MAEQEIKKQENPSKETNPVAPDLSSTTPSDGSKGKKEKGKPSVKKIVGWVLTALLIVVLIVSIVLILRIKRSDKPFLFGYATYYVATDSMETTIMTHDVIIVEELSDPHAQLQEGDIITFRARAGMFDNNKLPAGTPVTHRIIRIEGENIYTRGDHNQFDDKLPITYNDVIGRYTKTSTAMTKVYSVIKSKYAFLLLVFIPLMILLAVQVVNFIRACKMDDDGKTPKERTEEEIKEAAVKEKEEEIRRKAIEEYLAGKKKETPGAEEDTPNAKGKE